MSHKVPIDHNDLIKSGHLSPDSRPTLVGDNQVYACYLTKGGNKYPKFNITTKDDVEKAINAVNINPSLPPKVAELAKYWIKQASVDFGIDPGWDVRSPENLNDRTVSIDDNNHNNITNYGFTLKTATFVMDNPYKIKSACDYFLTNIDYASGSDRHHISGAIVKAAAGYGYTPPPEVVAYSNLSYGNKVEPLLEKRAQATGNEDYKKAYTDLTTVYNHLPPVEFLNIVTSLDKSAGIIDNTIPAYKFFVVDDDGSALSKLASSIKEPLYKKFEEDE